MINNLRKRENNLIRDSNFTFQHNKEDDLTKWEEKETSDFLDRFWEFKKATKVLETNIDLVNMEINKDPQLIGEQLTSIEECISKMLKVLNYGELVLNLNRKFSDVIIEKKSEGKKLKKN